MFRGSFEHTLDNKGRLSIPSKFRDVLVGKGDERIVITNFVIDSISSFKKNLAVIYQNQRQGVMDREGTIKVEPTYREIKINDDGSVEVKQPDIPKTLDSSLVVTAITNDPDFIQKLVSASQIDRLNIGAMPTNQVSWDQPHEGNLFEHLYGRRAFQYAVAGE